MLNGRPVNLRDCKNAHRSLATILTILACAGTPPAFAGQEEKEFASTQKMLMTGDTIKLKEACTKWLAANTKLKPQWSELHSLSNIYYSHNPELDKAGEAARLAPKDVHILTTYALALFQERKRKEALDMSVAALQVNPRDKRAEVVHRVIEAACNEEKPTMSRTDLLSLAQNGGSLVETYVAVSTYFMHRLDKAKTQAVLDALVKNNPQSSYAYCRRGMEERRNGKYKLSIEDLKKALQLQPRNVEAAVNLIELQFRAKQYEDSIATHKLLERLGVDYVLGYTICGDSHVALHQYNDAITRYSDAILLMNVRGTPVEQMKFVKTFSTNLKRELVSLWTKRAEAYRQVKKYDLALSDLRLARLVYPQDELGPEIRARIYKDQGKYKEALDEVTALTTTRPHLSRLYRERAEILRKLGRNAEAEGDAKRASGMELDSSKLKLQQVKLR